MEEALLLAGWGLLPISKLEIYTRWRASYHRIPVHQAIKSELTLYIDLRLGQTCHSKDGGSSIFRWRGRAWLTIWDRVKIPRYSHKLMHRKRVTCELHDSYFRSMMIKTCHSKDGGSDIFHWPFMGRDWVGVELLYNSVHRKFNQFGDQESWRNDAVEKTAPSRELGSWASSWAALENEKYTLLCLEEMGRSICGSLCSVSNSLSHSTLSIKWEVYFSKRLSRSLLLCRRYDSLWVHLHMSIQHWLKSSLCK